MALTDVGTGNTVTGTTSVTPNTVSGSLAGDVCYLFVASKRSGTGTQPSAPANWTEVANTVVGTGTPGPDNGPIRLQVFKRVAETGGQFGSNMPTITRSGDGSVLAVRTRVFRVAENEAIDEDFVSGSDTSSDATFSVTANPGLDLTAGDHLELWTAFTSDGVNAQSGSTTLFVSGVTFDELTSLNGNGTSNGDDFRVILNSAEVASGFSAGGALTYGLTLSGSTTGGALILRLRAVPNYATIDGTGSADLGGLAAAATGTVVPAEDGIVWGDGSATLGGLVAQADGVRQRMLHRAFAVVENDQPLSGAASSEPYGALASTVVSQIRADVST